MKNIIKWKKDSKLYEYPDDVLVVGVALTEPAIQASFSTEDVKNEKWIQRVKKLVEDFNKTLFEPLYYCKKCRWIENGGHRIAVATELKIPVDVMIHNSCITLTNKFSSRKDWTPKWEKQPERKVWGVTSEIFRNQGATAHYLQIIKGGYCSEHRHAQKTNMFFIIKGILELDFWWKDGTVRTITMKAGEPPREIPLGFFHKFRAVTDVECIEIYDYQYDGVDIERRTSGGLLKEMTP